MNVLYGILILLAADAFAIGALLLVRRRAPEGSYFSDGDRASGVFGVLAGGFAIFAGFVIFLAFTRYDESRAGGEAEALTLVQQWETAQFLPAVQRTRLSGELTCYGRYVVSEEWPALEAGRGTETFNPWSIALFRTLREVRPGSDVEQSAYDKWLDQTSDREEARRDRTHAAVGIIPAPVWIVLFLSAGTIFCFMLFFADSAERARSQAMLIGSATTVVVATLLVISTLDSPYHSGVGGIEPTAMDRALVTIDEARSVLGDTSPPPCDERGQANA